MLAKSGASVYNQKDENVGLQSGISSCPRAKLSTHGRSYSSDGGRNAYSILHMHRIYMRMHCIYEKSGLAVSLGGALPLNISGIRSHSCLK